MFGISLSKFKNIVGIFKVAWEVLKEVKELVEIVEKADQNDEKKNGAKKKQAVMDIVKSVYDAADKTVGVPIEKKTIVELADNGVEVFVDLFNVVNKFRSKSE